MSFKQSNKRMLRSKTDSSLSGLGWNRFSNVLNIFKDKARFIPFLERLEVRDVPTISVLNTLDSGPGSLRQAILDANSNPGFDTINFNIPGAGVRTINLTSGQLPAITDPVLIDGYSQAGASPNTLANGDNAVILVSLAGTNAQGSAGLTLSGSGSTIQGLAVNGFEKGIWLTGSSGNKILGNFIGTTPDGSVAVGNQVGIQIDQGSSNNTIGGTVANARNVISSNRSNGIQVNGNSAPIGAQDWWQGEGNALDFFGGNNGTLVNGVTFAPGEVGQAFNFNGSNYVSVADNPSLSLTNGFTIEAWVNPSSFNGKGRIISKGTGGVSGYGFGALSDGRLEFTTYGLKDYDTTGKYVPLNTWTHVAVVFDSNNTANFYVNGVLKESITGPAPARVTTQELRIGTAQSSFEAWRGLLDEIGIYPRQVSATEIQAIFNAGNQGKGGNTIQGNFIGTNATDAGPLANASNGILLTNGASNTLVGGKSAGAGNTISGNTQAGLSITGNGVQGNLAFGNFIGVNSGGTAIPNSTYGVFVGGSATGNTIGSTAAGAGNIISRNSAAGVEIETTQTTIAGNTISFNGILPSGNPGSTTAGVRFFNGSSNTLISNTITGNFGSGVLVSAASTTNTISKNLIYGNGNISGPANTATGVSSGEIGIDLLSSADNQFTGSYPFRTLNDINDADTGGNGLLNTPVITSARIVGSNLVLTGFARPGAIIEFFGVDNDGEGKTYLGSFVEGSASDSDNSTGSYNFLNSGSDTTNRFNFTGTLPANVTNGTLITGTATLAGSTSEFSRKIMVKTSGTAPSGSGPSAKVTGGPSGSIAEGTAITNLTATPAEPGVYTYAWNVTKNGVAYGPTGNSQTFSFTPDDNGTYLVTMTITGEDGASTTIPWSVGPNLMVNGGFESPPTTGLFFSTIPGWTLASGPIIEIQHGGIAGTPFEGNALAELDTYSSSSIYQDIATVPGQN